MNGTHQSVHSKGSILRSRSSVWSDFREATFMPVGFLALYLSSYRQGYAGPAGPPSGSQGSLSGRTGGRTVFKEPMRAYRCPGTPQDPADDRPYIQ